MVFPAKVTEKVLLLLQADRFCRDEQMSAHLVSLHHNWNVNHYDMPIYIAKSNIFIIKK